MDIRSIKQTKETGKNNNENMAQLDDAIRSAFGQLGTAKNLLPTASLEIRDLGFLTEEDNVRLSLIHI